MADAYLTFQKFTDPRLAAAIAKKLSEFHIETLIEDASSLLNPHLIGSTPEPAIHLKVRSSDLPRAHQVLEEYYERHLDDVDPDYYLLSFTDRELMNVIANPDEWGLFDQALAKKLMTGHGYTLTPKEIERYKRQKPPEPPTPPDLHSTWQHMNRIFTFFDHVIDNAAERIDHWLKKKTPRRRNKP